MPTLAEFLTATQWAAIITVICGAIATLGFLFNWGIRFRFVGITGFMGVLTVGLFALSLMPITRVEIPGAVRFSTVYDSGSTQVVIAVPPDISKEQLTATLQQAANDLFSPGRLGRGGENQMTIRARTVTHPQDGLTQLVYLGQVKRSLFDRNDDKMEISISEGLGVGG
ncbi:MAG: Ycf51 family protein [Elainellaceae cyanobacterium]